ncbi:hypothetical protein GCM10010406_23710 [Streptomyces thermolineatus]|uniref:Mycothiol-dependent maleylpyruvate isomerase metal-binding domain-containing protein n=1 Tax=Streptomyces thermolineatus TaxID=44033 RepID=A0ABN3LM76_9ACTN
MPSVDHRDVDRAVAESLRVLGPLASRDWRVRAGPLEWSCLRTAAHIAHDLLACAGQVTGRPDDAYLPFDLVVPPDASPRDLLRVVAACGGLLGSAVAAAGPDVRAWHYGPCDPAGFAAMGVAETLLHTHDITRGLDVPWLPPEPLCANVLGRLFPDAPPGDPAPVLPWCTGRAGLDGRPRRTSWTWDAALA